jgi:hypothetical protein
MITYHMKFKRSFVFLIIFLALNCQAFAQNDLNAKEIQYDRLTRTISVEVTGGIAPYNFILTKVELPTLQVSAFVKEIINKSYKFTNLSSGEYFITIKDSKGNITTTKHVFVD